MSINDLQTLSILLLVACGFILRQRVRFLERCVLTLQDLELVRDEDKAREGAE